MEIPQSAGHGSVRDIDYLFEFSPEADTHLDDNLLVVPVTEAIADTGSETQSFAVQRGASNNTLSLKVTIAYGLF